jgi:hypothetical protein
MQTFKKLAAAAFAGAAVTAALMLPGSAAQAGPGDRAATSAAKVTTVVAPAATVHGCPSGYVCIYPGESYNGDVPSLKFLTYGAHNLSNQYGWKYILNNQTGGAIARICDGYNGTNCWLTIYPGETWDIDFTPVNSVYLAP